LSQTQNFTGIFLHLFLNYRVFTGIKQFLMGHIIKLQFIDMGTSNATFQCSTIIEIFFLSLFLKIFIVISKIIFLFENCF